MPPTDASPATLLGPEQVARAASAHFGEAVQSISAPGGKGRASVRVTLESRSVIATQRPDPQGFAIEKTVLQTLSAANAPVPRFLGTRGALLFQEDAGRARLSAQLAHLPAARVDTIVAAAFQSLWQLKRIADETGLTETLPAVAMSHDWLTPFCNMPGQLSRRLGLPAPALDMEALATGLVAAPRYFVKWDARPGNAAVQADGRVIWFDWEHVGRRAGFEDFAFLAGDEFWTLGADRSLELFARASERVSDSALRFLVCFTTLQAVQRLDMILNRIERAGWTDGDRALRLDKIGATPQMAQRLSLHGADWAARDARVAPLAGWFEKVGAALIARTPPPQA